MILYPQTSTPTNYDDLCLHIENCYKKAEHFFKRSFIRPTIRVDLKGNSAGTATPQDNLLRFNYQLFCNNTSHFLKQTVPHEVAHLLAYQIFGLNIKPHGKEWQYIMLTVFQVPAERCHEYEVKKTKQLHYLYQCQCSTHSLTSRRHSLIKRGYQYICKKCKHSLIFADKKLY